MIYKKAQGSGGSAASLVAVLGALILLYILFLPPEARQGLLDDTSGSGISQPGESTLTGEESLLLMETPGTLSVVSDDEFEHNIPSFNLYTTTSASVLKEVANIYLKKSLFSSEEKDIVFEIEDIGNTENILLSFTPTTHSGRLIISINGNEIFNAETEDTVQPINLERQYLEEDNILHFEVSGVGLAFWSSNEYALGNLKVTADITYIGNRESVHSFFLTSEEADNLKTTDLRFFAECDKDAVGPLTIKINENTIFSSVPDCGSANPPIQFSPDLLNDGQNNLYFGTTSGNYLLDQVRVTTELKELIYQTYFFEMSSNLFDSVAITVHECGDTDGYCPSNCDEDLDVDCCFEVSTNYWCDVETDNENYRCVSSVSEDECDVCDSGYEDENGNSASTCEGMCGDDTDGDCPSGCSENYDKDCCFENDNWWCDDLATAGLNSICEAGVSASECDDCAYGYYNQDNDEPGCPEDTGISEEFFLLNQFDTVLTLEFIDDNERKLADVFINGRQFSIDTYDSDYSRNIDNYVEPGSNGLTIKPVGDSITIVELKVEIEE